MSKYGIKPDYEPPEGYDADDCVHGQPQDVVCQFCQETEISKLRKALVVADKALEHYGDKGHWWIAPKAFAENVSERQRNLDVLFVVGVDYGEMRNGYEIAQQARTEIADILEGKE